MTKSRKETTKLLSELLECRLNPSNDPRIYTAKEVTFDYNSSHPIRVDYMQFKPVNNTVSGIEKGDFYCYEIKSSVEDFNSKNGHNFIGDYNYYVMTHDTYLKIDAPIPWDVGVLTADPEHPEFGFVKQKNAHRKSRTRSVSEMLLMMFRSANREIIKRKKEPVAPELPCEPGSTMYRVAHRINGEAYVAPVRDVSFEMFRNFTHVRDSEGVAYTLGVEIFPSEKEANSAAEKENKLRGTIP